MKEDIKIYLRKLAEKYETASFLDGDPSWFMHQVHGDRNQETMAFVASVLSYGSRKQFLPKIDYIMKSSNHDIYKWVYEGEYKHFIQNNSDCFYRLYTNKTMLSFFDAYRKLIIDWDTIGNYIRCKAPNALTAMDYICSFFASENVKVIPQDIKSPCKRLAMFFRWMVRDNSPVDIGLWKFIDKRTLVIPLDIHVMQEAQSLNLINTKTSSMRTALKLTDVMREVFPDDPTRGDFALFGYGVDKDSHNNNKQ